MVFSHLAFFLTRPHCHTTVTKHSSTLGYLSDPRTSRLTIHNPKRNTSAAFKNRNDIKSLQLSSLYELLYYFFGQVRLLQELVIGYCNSWTNESSKYLKLQMHERTKQTWLKLNQESTEESTLEVDFSVPWTHHDPEDLGLTCLTKALIKSLLTS